MNRLYMTAIETNYPLVSIVIPLWNTEKYIGPMIQSILNQTYTAWELIIVDDLSTDQSAEVVRSFHSDKIRFISRSRVPKGAQTCRNIGIEAANGKYLIIFDSDDLISRYCLEQRVAFMEAHLDLDFAISKATSFRNEKELDGELIPIYGIKKPGMDELCSFLSKKYDFTVWSCIYRLKSIRESKLFWDEKIHVYQDFDFILQTLFSHFSYAYIDDAQVDYFYRVGHSASTVCSNFTTDAKKKSTIYLFDKVLDRLKSRDDFDVRKSQFSSFVILHFERLIQDKCYADAHHYLDMLSAYYSIDYVANLRSITNKCGHISNDKIRAIILHYYLYQNMGERYYRKFFIREIIKLLLNKPFTKP